MPDIKKGTYNFSDSMESSICLYALMFNVSVGHKNRVKERTAVLAALIVSIYAFMYLCCFEHNTEARSLC